MLNRLMRCRAVQRWLAGFILGTAGILFCAPGVSAHGGLSALEGLWIVFVFLVGLGAAAAIWFGASLYLLLSRKTRMRLIVPALYLGYTVLLLRVLRFVASSTREDAGLMFNVGVLMVVAFTVFVLHKRREAFS